MEKLLYEIIPPPRSWSHGKVETWTQDLCLMLEKEEVKFITIPEVVHESREGERVVQLVDKIDSLEFAEIIRKSSRAVAPVPNKICVRASKKELLEWVERAQAMGIGSIVLVGGDDSGASYPGPSVLQAAEMIKSEFPRIKLGGITIFTRREEAARMLGKMRHGLDFFVSQIIFETANMKCVLLDLQKLCLDNRIEMPRIYLSLAPATAKVDIEFMQWLGVEFPTAVLSYFMDREEEGIAERVFEVLDFTLDELAHFISKTNFDIGFNVEQIMYKSRDSGERLLRLVKKMVGNCQS